MELRHLETMVVIADLKSFTKAAEKLCITQPTVSKQVLDLEQALGVRLFDRSKRFVTLTKGGELVYRHARDLLSRRRDLLAAVDAFKGLRKGSLAVGASNIPGIYILPHILTMYKRAYGDISVSLTVSDTRETMVRMSEGEIDIGFVGARADEKGFVYREVIEDTIVFIGSPGAPDAIRVRRLKEHPFVAREEGSGTRNAFEKILMESAGIDLSGLRIAAQFSDTEAVKQAVKNGMGISFISRMAIASEIRDGSLKVVRVEGIPEIRRSFYMVTRRGRTIPPQVKALIELVEDWRKHETN